MTVLPACFVSAKELANFGILNYLIARNWNENKKVVSYGPMMITVNWSRFPASTWWSRIIVNFSKRAFSANLNLAFFVVKLTAVVFIMIWSRSRTLLWLSPWINNLELKELRAENCCLFSGRDTLQIVSLIRNHWESFRACSVHNLKNICSIDLSGERARSRFTRTCYDHPLNLFLLVTVVIQLLRRINYTETSCSWQCFCSLLLVLLNSTCNICTTISTSSTRFLCVCVCVELLVLFFEACEFGPRSCKLNDRKNSVNIVSAYFS